MCGIAGILQGEGVSQTDAIQCMTAAMAHRGPDADGHWVNGPVALGHRRLSIIDLSPESNQPFLSDDGRYVVVFNGEIYNYKEVNAQLVHKVFRTSGDTETILHAFTEWGIACLEKLKGMFAFAIWDRQEEQLTVARDRFGVKPLYYAQTDRAFVFASEVRAILASGYVKPEISEDGLFEYLKYQSAGYPYTLVKQVRQLGAGEYLTYKQGRLSFHRYWDLFEILPTPPGIQPGEVRSEIYRLMLQSVERRMVADVPVAAFLSGGIDSSAVVGLMAQVTESPVRTFNIYFDEEAYNEREYAELVAKKFRTEHTGIHMQPKDFLDEVEAALQAMDTPSADGINTYVVSKAIKQAGIKVALSGLGGDELFAGYPVFNQFMQLRKAAPLWNVSKPVRALAGAMAGGASNRQQRLKELMALDSPEIEAFYPISRALLSDRQISAFTHLQPRRTGLEQCLDMHAQQIHQFPLYSQVSLAELSGYTQQTLLKDTDQMSMAVSLEVREPFFDHELVRYILSVPDHIKKPRYPKQLLVESLGSLLPEQIVHRKKKGFSFPWKLWMRKELASFCTARIHAICQRNFMRGDALKQKWDGFLRGDESMRWAEFWAFVVLEDWLTQHDIR